MAKAFSSKCRTNWTCSIWFRCRSAQNGLVTLELSSDHWRHREGFELTDPGTDLTGALDQANYCIKCHNQGKDSCSTGLKEKAGAFKSSVFGVTLAGCPLEEKISEMNVVKEHGNPIGALAIVTIDNPMAAGTGHRICNDCMKSCIFQKQEPVDIPQVETRTLKDVLELPWGFEIYSLLTRWNPLNFARPLPLSRDRLEGAGGRPGAGGLHAVASSDERRPHRGGGRRIEDRAAAAGYLGRRCASASACRFGRSATSPRSTNAGRARDGGLRRRGRIRHHRPLEQEFPEGDPAAAGTPSEFTMFGGVRFGGTLTVDSAFEMGFDHIALCAGAGGRR